MFSYVCAAIASRHASMYCSSFSTGTATVTDGVALVAGVAVLHLRPTRESRPHEVTHAVERQLLGELLHVVRLLWARSHEREVTVQDVQELWELVEMGPAQDATEPRDARIVVLCPLVQRGTRTRIHCPELHDPEQLAVLAYSFLPIEQRAVVADEVAGEHEWQYEHEADAADGSDNDIEQPLHAQVTRAVELADVEEQ